MSISKLIRAALIGALIGIPLSLSANSLNLSGTNSIAYQGFSEGAGSASLSLPGGCSVPVGGLNGSTVSTLGSCVCIGGGGSDKANANGAAAGSYNPFYATGTTGASSQYQVPAGQNFYITDLWFGASGATGAAVQIGYSSAKLTAESQTATPVGAVYFFSSPTGALGATGMNGPFYIGIQSAFSFLHWSLPIGYIPNNYYPFYRPVGPYAAGQAYVILCGVVGT